MFNMSNMSSENVRLMWITIVQGIAYVGGMFLVVLVVLRLIRRHPNSAKLQASNEVASLCITILGTLYTVVLAFMLFAVWNRFESAKTTAEREAIELMTCYRLTKGLPAQERNKVDTRLAAYAARVVNKEWKTMASQKEDKEDKDTKRYVEGLWDDITTIRTKDSNNSAIKDQLLSHFIGMTQARAGRLVLAQSGLPDVLWVMMLIGGLLTVCATCLFYVERFNMHLFNVTVLSTMITLVLYTTNLIDNPFQGYVSVQPEGIKAASDYMESIKKK